MPGRTRSKCGAGVGRAWRPSWPGAAPRGRSPARSATRDGLDEALLLRPHRRVLGLVGVGEVRPDADDPDGALGLAAGAAAATRSGQSSPTRPSRPRPVSTLRCTRAVPAGAARGGGDLVERPERRGRQVDVGARPRRRSRSPGHVQPGQHAAPVTPAARSASASSSWATPSQVAPPRDARRGRRAAARGRSRRP